MTIAECLRVSISERDLEWCMIEIVESWNSDHFRKWEFGMFDSQTRGNYNQLID